MNAAVRLRVLPHESGPWVVVHGGRRTAVPPPVGRVLLPLQDRRLDADRLRSELGRIGRGYSEREIASLSEFLIGRGPVRTRRRALWLRLPLVPARWTAGCAARLSPLASWPALALLALVGGAAYLAAPSPAAGPVSLPAVLGLFLLTALWHEFGHAAALAREGYPPGGIGAGLLFLLPVLFADVSLLGALPCRSRLRVDLAGAGFQAALGGLLYWAGAWFAPARAAGWAALFAVGWSLLPFIRSDGYWALCDALGLADLRSPPPPGRHRAVRLFVHAFRLAGWGFLVLVCGTMILRVASLVRRWI